MKFTRRSLPFAPQVESLFFISGFSALVLEVVYARLLRYWTGNTASAVAAVLCAYLGGLAVGAYAGGKWLARRKRPLAIYAGLELAIGFYSLALPRLTEVLGPAYLWVTGHLGPDNHSAPVAHFLVSLTLLGLPTVLMGASFPVVVRAASGSSADRPLVAERLYVANLLGAALGTFLSDFLFIRFWGLGKTFVLVAVLSLGVFAWALWLEGQSPVWVEENLPEPGPGARPAGRGVLLFAAFSGGFLVLFQEIVWTHTVGVFLDTTVYGFAITLFMVIAGLGLGASLVARYREKRAAAELLPWMCVGAGSLALLLVPFWDNARILAARHPAWSVYVAIAILGAAAIVLAPQPKTLGYVLAAFPALGLAAFVGLRFGRADMFFWIHQGIVLSVAALFMLGPAVLMGMVFPLVMDCYLTLAPGEAGHTVAPVYALNTLGSVMGVVTATYLALPPLGLDRGGRAVGLSFLALGLFLLARQTGKGWVMALPLIPALAWMLLVAPWDFFKNHSALGHAGKLIYAREDLTGGVTTVLEDADTRDLYSNALFQGGSGYIAGDQARFALVPLLYTRELDRAMVIGVGSGQTAGVLGLFPFKRLELVDYSPGVVEAARNFFSEANLGVFSDPRVKVHIADGRHYLLTHPERLSLLTLEITRLWVAAEGDLYTREFYEICSARLTDRGVLEQWLPLFSLNPPDAMILLRTVRQVFPYVALYLGTENGMIVASRSPLEIDSARLKALDSEPRLAPVLKGVGLPRVFSLLGDCVLAPEKLDALLAETPDRSFSTDFWPHLEYSTAHYFVASPTTMEMRRYFLSAQEFQIAPVVGADAGALAEIRKWAFEERRSQQDWVPPLQVQPTLR